MDQEILDLTAATAFLLLSPGALFLISSLVLFDEVSIFLPARKYSIGSLFEHGPRSISLFVNHYS